MSEEQVKEDHWIETGSKNTENPIKPVKYDRSTSYCNNTAAISVFDRDELKFLL